MIENTIYYQYNQYNQYNQTKATQYISTKTCGCKTLYFYPMCTKQDLKHGGCIESCSCFKYKIIVDKCIKHK